MAFPFKGADALILFNGEPYSPDCNFLYHSGIDADNTALVWTKNGKTIITSGMNARKCKAESRHPVKVLGRGMRFSDALNSIIPRGAKKIGLDMDALPASRYVALKKKIRGKFVDMSDELLKLRSIKTAKEISTIKNAAKLSLRILDSLKFSTSMSELDVVRALSIACAKEGVQFAYPPIVATGKNSALPHHTPTKKKLSRVVLIDFGVKIGNYCSDLTRCYFLGNAKEEKEKYAEAKNVFSSIVGSLHKCKTAGDVAKLGDRVIAEEGWPLLPHSIGHGIGLEVHESPRLFSANKHSLSNGMVMAIEPGFYGAKFGVRYENEVLFSKRGCKVLI